MKNILIIISIIFVSGCTSNAPRLQDLQSKKLEPPEGMTLLYVLREDIYSCAPFISSPFVFGGEVLGHTKCGQYLYYYTYPMVLEFVRNDELVSVDLKAGDINYLIYRYPQRGGAGSLGYEELTQSEGRRLVNEYHLSSELKKVTLGIKPSSYLTETDTGQKLHSQLLYDDQTKIGSISLFGNLSKRNMAIKQIEKICSTKNVAIKVGSNLHKYGAIYTTLNESLIDNKYTIKFECLY